MHENGAANGVDFDMDLLANGDEGGAPSEDGMRSWRRHLNEEILNPVFNMVKASVPAETFRTFRVSCRASSRGFWGY